MDLLCITDDVGFGQLLSERLSDVGVSLKVVDRVAAGMVDRSKVSGVIVSSSCLPNLEGSDFSSDVPTFLYLDSGGFFASKDKTFDAVFTEAGERLGKRIKFHMELENMKRKNERLVFEDLTMDLIERTVKRSDRTINLSNKEFCLLEYLMRNSKKVVTRSDILEHVWGMNAFSMSNTIEVHIRSLRRKLDKPFDRKLIRTIHCVGYLFG